MGAARQRGPSSWLLDYYAPNGRRCRETIRAESRGEAERMLNQSTLRLAVKARLLSHDHVPHIPLDEAASRSGFFGLLWPIDQHGSEDNEAKHQQ